MLTKYICVSDIAKIHGYTNFTDFLWYISKYATIQNWGKNWCNLEISSTRHESFIAKKIQDFHQVPLKSCLQYYLEQETFCSALKERILNKDFVISTLQDATEKSEDKRFVTIHSFLRQSRHPLDALIYALEEPIEHSAADIFIRPCNISVPDDYRNIMPVSLSGTAKDEDHLFVFRAKVDNGVCFLHLDVLASCEGLNLWTGTYKICITGSEHHIQKMVYPDFLVECRENKIERPESGVYSVKYSDFQNKFTSQDVPDVENFLDIMNVLNYKAFLDSVNSDNVYTAGEPNTTKQTQNKECNIRGHYRKLNSGRITYVTPHKRRY